MATEVRAAHNKAMTPRFLQGVFTFEGQGIDQPFPLSEALSYTVPDGAIAQPLYFRGGNSTAELVYLVLTRDGQPMRYFPVGAKAGVYLPLRIIEDLDGGTTLELQLAAPEGVAGTVVVDLGITELRQDPAGPSNR
jgi:hypothetical protein